MGSKKLSDKQREDILNLLWPVLPKVKGYKDRRKVGDNHINKTKDGLIATLEYIIFEKKTDD